MNSNRDEIAYYRDSTGNEVDFIFKNHAIEVKIKQNITSKDVKGLLIFGKDYGYNLHIVCTCDRKRIEQFSGQMITIWPVQEFLESLWSDQI